MKLITVTTLNKHEWYKPFQIVCLFVNSCAQYNELYAVALGYNIEVIIKTKPKTKTKTEQKK